MTSERDVEALVRDLPLGGRVEQQRAVGEALRALLVREQQGIVLADEVGFGKTYEALAIASLLAEHHRGTPQPVQRVLVLCKPALISKWCDETGGSDPPGGARSGGQRRGFLQYLDHWRDRPFRKLLEDPTPVEGRYGAYRLRQDGLKGVRRGGHDQVPPGFYVVNWSMLGEERRAKNTLLRQLWFTRWDVVIVDEAHHVAKLTKPGLIFAPGYDFANQEGTISAGKYRYLLALTATPFELGPRELVNLLRLVRGHPEDIRVAEEGLGRYVAKLDRFFSFRGRSPDDPLRREVVSALADLRDKCALGPGERGPGLQAVLRRYLIRNTKSGQRRRYNLVTRESGRYGLAPFEKLQDLKALTAKSPLIPFRGRDVLFYLRLRELLSAIEARRREDANTRRAFVSMDLQQGLSSYPQIENSTVLARRTEEARRLRTLVRRWNSRRTLHLHPKVTALRDVIGEIVDQETQRMRNRSQAWFSKIVVFNNLISGTAIQLRSVLQKVVEERLDTLLRELLEQARLGRPVAFGRRIGRIARQSVDEAIQKMARWPPALVTPALASAMGEEEVERRVGRPLLAVCREMLIRRTHQPLFLLRLLLMQRTSSDEAVRHFVDQELVGPVVGKLNTIVLRHLVPRAGDTEGTGTEPIELAAQRFRSVLDEVRSVELVGRFDGEDTRHRDARLKNFNDYYNPYLLLVGRVGEEGIDLQRHASYVLHYDLEWNQARMEQREGRVDRDGWSAADPRGFVDVRFFLLKATYEERIFHALMQRDQWFQVLIGSKRSELGTIRDGDDDGIELHPLVGQLTDGERQRVMIDLRPPPLASEHADEELGVAASGLRPR